MKTVCCAAFVTLCFVSSAHAANVYSGCSTPPTTFRHVWYFDPVNGRTSADGGNGSQSAPWNNLQALIEAEPGYSYPLLTSAPYRQVPVPGQPAVTQTGPNAGPVQPGDEILLMSGNYGDIFIGGLTTEISNTDFVTVAAAPGQTPVLTSLFVGETNAWMFNGLKVQSLQPAARSGNALVQLKDAGASLPTSDIVLVNMIISSADSTAGWSQAQWITNGRNGFSALSTAPGSNTKCVSFTGSHISNVRFGAVLFANQLIFSNNQVDHFGDDGIDYAASNLAITKNNVHDNLDVGDGNHEDAMQGQIGIPASGATVNNLQNILIDSNLIVRQTDPGLSFPTQLQGIDAFDSDWTNITVTNNVVITSACWGIAFSSIHNGVIANNTVIADGLVATPGCIANVAVGTTTHQGAQSTNTVLRNNLASQIEISTPVTSVTADHNIVTPSGFSPDLVYYVNGAAHFFGAPGTYANSNIIASGGPTSEFVNYNPAALTYNLMLKAGASAINAATAAGAPTLDIFGVTRSAPYTAGAYGYPY
jgi:hypothetical protein